MKIHLNQAVLSYTTIMNLKDEKIPLRTAYKINSLINTLEKEVEFYNQKLNMIIQENALFDENNQYIFTEDKSGIKIKEDRLEDCKQAMEELDQLEIEIEDTYFSIEELDNLTISISEMKNLMPFIKE